MASYAFSPTSYKLSPETFKLLMHFSCKQMPEGAAILLASTIADSFPYEDLPKDTSTLKQFLISKKLHILSIIDTINEHYYISENMVERIYEAILAFWEWRIAIARGQSTPIFTKGPQSTIDELSRIPFFIDSSYLCEINNVYDSANTHIRLFKNVINELQTMK
jgi:hypothetical protein